jgi:hypothetical protein
MRDTQQQRSISGIRNALGVIAVVLVMTTCTYGQGQSRRKPRATRNTTTLTERIALAIKTSPAFKAPEYVQTPTHCECNKQVAEVLKKLNILDDSGNFTAKGLEVKKSWLAFGDERNPEVFSIPVGTRKFIRVVGSERTHPDGTFVTTFEWEFEPTEIGKGLNMIIEHRTAEATFYGGQTELPVIVFQSSISVPDFTKSN